MNPRYFILTCFFTSLSFAHLKGDLIQGNAVGSIRNAPYSGYNNSSSYGYTDTSTTSNSGTAGTGGSSGTAQNAPTSGVIQKTGTPNAKLPGKLPPISKKGSVIKERIKPQKVEMNFGEPTYTYPGFIARVGQRWLGTDYLYNMPKDIGLKIEIEKSPGKNIPINTEILLKSVEDIYREMDFYPEAQVTANSPPLPFLHILIFLDETESRNVAYVSGRLFEGVTLDRIDFNPIGTWQAITWEKQELLITSKQQFGEQLKETVDNIVKTLLERIRYYEFLKEETESDVKIYNPHSPVIEHRNAGNANYAPHHALPATTQPLPVNTSRPVTLPQTPAIQPLPVTAPTSATSPQPMTAPTVKTQLVP